jgi:Golgi nucleoside diphosphatase
MNKITLNDEVYDIYKENKDEPKKVLPRFNSDEKTKKDSLSKSKFSSIAGIKHSKLIEDIKEEFE